MPTTDPWLAFFAALVSLSLVACEGKMPPKGDILLLKGGKDSLCLTHRDCASDECRLGRCTEKVEKVGLGGECQGHQYCKAGFYCAAKAKKCAPVVRCEDVQDRLESCIEEVYLAFRPTQKTRLRRMRPQVRKRFLARSQKLLYDSMCRVTKVNGLTFERAVKFVAARQQKECPGFAKALKDAVGK